MIKRSQSIINRLFKNPLVSSWGKPEKPELYNKSNKWVKLDFYAYSGVLGVLAIWQLLCMFHIVPAFMLPSPVNIVSAFLSSWPVLVTHLKVTLFEAFSGLLISVMLALLFAIIMDSFQCVYRTLYPLLIITQTIPVIAIAPLLVLWLGYGIMPKIVLIILVCFFPLTVALLDGIGSCDLDIQNLLKAMGATKRQLLIHAKLPGALPSFFSGLKIAVSYSVVGAVISEWLGGDKGLGVYMTRVRKSYAYDKMFTVIFLIIIISLILMKLVLISEKKFMPWRRTEE